MAEYYNLSSLERVIRLINDENPSARLTVDNVTLGNPSPSAVNDKNTVVRVTAVAGRGRSGLRDYYYDRLQLNTFFQQYLNQPAGPVEVDINGAVNSYDLLPRIRERYGLGIAQSDVMGEALIGSSYTLKALPTSLGWLGSVQLNIVPRLTNIATMLSTLQLPLFTPSIYDTPSDQQLLNRINAANNTNFTLNDVEFIGLYAAPGGTLSSADIIVRLQGKPSALLTGTVDIRYTRRHTADVYPALQPTSFPYEVITSEAQALGLLSLNDDVILVGSEVDLDAVGPDPDRLTLRMTTASLLWVPTESVGFSLAKIPLNLAAFSKDWTGLTNGNVSAFTVFQKDVVEYLFSTNTGINPVNNPLRIGELAQVTAPDRFVLIPSTLTAITGTHNTQVTLAATANNPRYMNTVPVKYNRVDAASLYPVGLDVTAAGNQSATTTRSLWDSLQTTLGWNIPSSFIVNQAIAADATDITITFSEGQFLFIPGSQFTLTIARAAVVAGDSNFALDDGSALALDDGSLFMLDDVA